MTRICNACNTTKPIRATTRVWEENNKLFTICEDCIAAMNAASTLLEALANNKPPFAPKEVTDD